jgi:hypothetical protein
MTGISYAGKYRRGIEERQTMEKILSLSMTVSLYLMYSVEMYFIPFLAALLLQCPLFNHVLWLHKL